MLLLLCYVAAAELFKEETFDWLKKSALEQVVVFYRSSSPESIKQLRIAERAVAQISKYPSTKHLQYHKCDGDIEANRKDFKEASFTEPFTLFTVTPYAGIEKYNGASSVNEIVEHVQHKYLPIQDSDIIEFSDEDTFWELVDSKNSPKPVFVKFHEQCEACKRLAPTFSRAATYFADKVAFVSVLCSKDQQTTQFCRRHGITTHPTLVLFKGEEKVVYGKDDKTIKTIEAFFARHLGWETGKDQAKASDNLEAEPVVSAPEQPKTTTASSPPNPTPAAPAASQASGFGVLERLEQVHAELAGILHQFHEKLSMVRVLTAELRASARPTTPPVTTINKDDL